MNSQQTLLAAVRAIHFLSCIVAAGIWGFDRVVFPRNSWDSAARPSFRRLAIVSLLIALASGAAWFALVTLNMSGLPASQALRWDMLHRVWSQTTFGHVWQIRTAAWIVAMIATAMAAGRRQAIAAWLAWISASILLVTLAWAGHGQIGSSVHTLADAVHLFVAAIWPGGLWPLAIVLWRNRDDVAQRPHLARLAGRFSTVSIVAVGLLLASGVVNTCYLLRSPADLLHWPYGILLSAKIGLTLLAVMCGAINLLHFRPRLPAGSVRSMWKIIVIEQALVLGVLLIVGVLGQLPPGV